MTLVLVCVTIFYFSCSFLGRADICKGQKGGRKKKSRPLISSIVAKYDTILPLTQHPQSHTKFSKPELDSQPWTVAWMMKVTVGVTKSINKFCWSNRAIKQNKESRYVCY